MSNRQPKCCQASKSDRLMSWRLSCSHPGAIASRIWAFICPSPIAAISLTASIWGCTNCLPSTKVFTKRRRSSGSQLARNTPWADGSNMLLWAPIPSGSFRSLSTLHARHAKGNASANSAFMASKSPRFMGNSINLHR